MRSLKQAGAIAGIGCALALTGTTLTASPAFAAPPGDIPSSCNGVLNGEDSGRITKTITSVTTNKDGTSTIAFTFTSTRPNGTYRLRDCSFVDSNSDGSFTKGETIIAGTDNMTYVLTGGRGSGTITVPGSAGQRVCDRLALSGGDTEKSDGETDKSNVACVTLGQQPVPTSTVGALGLTGIGAAAVAGAIVIRRRRATN